MPVFVAPPTVIDINLGGTMKFKGDLVDLCKIHSAELPMEQEHHTGTFGWLGAMAAEAERQEDHYARQADTIYADIELQFREDYNKQGVKVTEAMLKSLLSTHSKIIAAQDAAADAKKTSKLCKNLFEVFKARKDIIVAMSYDLFSEQRNSEMPTSAPSRARTRAAK